MQFVHCTLSCGSRCINLICIIQNCAIVHMCYGNISRSKPVRLSLPSGYESHGGSYRHEAWDVKSKFIKKKKSSNPPSGTFTISEKAQYFPLKPLPRYWFDFDMLQWIKKPNWFYVMLYVVMWQWLLRYVPFFFLVGSILQSKGTGLFSFVIFPKRVISWKIK